MATIVPASPSDTLGTAELPWGGVYAATANLNALKLVPQTATQITAGGYGVANSQYLYVRSADSVPYIGAARIALYSDFEPTRQRLDAFFGPENATGVNPHYSYIPVGLDTLYSVAMAIIDLRDGVDGVSASVTALEARVDVLENCDCPTRLTELADVQRSEPVVAGQVLSYLGNDTWGNATIAQALSDLTDVDLSENVGEMQPLVYLEGKWVNGGVAKGSTNTVQLAGENSQIKSATSIEYVHSGGTKNVLQPADIDAEAGTYYPVDLGSEDKPFAVLYVEPSSVYLGATKLSSNDAAGPTGTLFVNNDAIAKRSEVSSLETRVKSLEDSGGGGSGHTHIGLMVEGTRAGQVVVTGENGVPATGSVIAPLLYDNLLQTTDTVELSSGDAGIVVNRTYYAAETTTVNITSTGLRAFDNFTFTAVDADAVITLSLDTDLYMVLSDDETEIYGGGYSAESDTFHNYTETLNLGTTTSITEGVGSLTIWYDPDGARWYGYGGGAYPVFCDFRRATLLPASAPMSLRDIAVASGQTVPTDAYYAYDDVVYTNTQSSTTLGMQAAYRFIGSADTTLYAADYAPDELSWLVVHNYSQNVVTLELTDDSASYSVSGSDFAVDISVDDPSVEKVAPNPQIPPGESLFAWFYPPDSAWRHSVVKLPLYLELTGVWADATQVAAPITVDQDVSIGVLYVTGQNAITTLTLQGTQPVADLDVFAVTCEGSAATVILPAGGVHSSLGVSQLADGTTELNVQTTTSAEPISVVIPVEQHAYFWFVSAERDPVYAGWHYASSSVYSGAAFPADIALQDTYIAPLFYPGVDTPTTVRQVGATDLGTPSRTFRDLYLSGQITAGGGGDVQALGLRRAVDVLDYAELQLSYAPLPVESLTLTVNGCVQTPDVDYTVDGTSVTWLALDFTLADDDKIIATYTRA